MLLSKVKSILGKYVKTKDRMILAFSGGPDSTCLLDLLIKAGYKPIAAHLNHRLRGKESDEDEKFVRALAKKYHLEYAGKSADVRAFARSQKMNLEEAARQIRYQFLEKVRKKEQAEWILTAHHLNDNLETVLLNISRGCFLPGLKGMQIKSGHLLRPLLETTKEEILTYLKENHLPYRIDQSNSDLKFARNRIRLEVIPQLKKINPKLEQTFLRQQKFWTELNQFFSKLAHSWLKKQGFLPAQTGISSRLRCFSIPEFKKLNPLFRKIILGEIYQKIYGSTYHLTFEQIQEVLELISRNKTGTLKKLGPNLIVQIRYNQAFFSPPSSLKSLKKKILKIPGETIFEKGKIKAVFLKKKPVRFSPKSIYLDFGKITLSGRGKIYLRSWQPGDRFTPLGLKGRKKLQDFFTSQKIPKEERSQIPLFIDSRGKILAVSTLALDENFKITPSTQKILRLSIEKTSKKTKL